MKEVETIEFKSIPEMFYKESLGLKRNTLRVWDKEDKRFQIIERFILGEIDLIICIKRTIDEQRFYRFVTDATKWEGQVILSW